MNAQDLRDLAAARHRQQFGQSGQSAVFPPADQNSGSAGSESVSTSGAVAQLISEVGPKLTPDQWIIIITLIADLVGKWIDRRFPRPPVS